MSRCCIAMLAIGCLCAHPELESMDKQNPKHQSPKIRITLIARIAPKQHDGPAIWEEVEHKNTLHSCVWSKRNTNDVLRGMMLFHKQEVVGLPRDPLVTHVKSTFGNNCPKIIGFFGAHAWYCSSVNGPFRIVENRLSNTLQVNHSGKLFREFNFKCIDAKSFVAFLSAPHKALENRMKRRHSL